MPARRGPLLRDAASAAFRDNPGAVEVCFKFDEGTPPCLNGGVKLESQATTVRFLSLPPLPSAAHWTQLWCACCAQCAAHRGARRQRAETQNTRGRQLHEGTPPWRAGFFRACNPAGASGVCVPVEF